jgi:nicotinate phosphoribosyltransferase
MSQSLQENISLLLDLYELTMAQGYWEAKKDIQLASFDLFVRELPHNRGYLINAGLGDIIDYIDNLRFTSEDIRYLEKQNLFKPEFLNYLAQFKFRGDIWAMSEGEVFFANEPIIRVTANIIEAQILESFFLNTINLQTMIATKASRVVLAAGDRKVYDFALRRTHGQDAAVKVARSSYIAGFFGTSNVLAGKIYGITIVGTMAHSYVMCFKKELDSFLSYAKAFPYKTILLVDTYNTKKGIEAAIKVGLRLKDQGCKLLGIRLDSGDLVSQSKMAKRMLNDAGLGEVGIFASGNLDEYKIHDLLRRGAKIDSFGVGTKMGVSQDAPFVDVIYKISEVTDRDGNFLPTMKLSEKKTTFPGRKQVFRICNSKGRFLKDVLALDGESTEGLPLLKQVVRKGKIIYTKPTLNQIRDFAKRNLAALGEEYKRIIKPGVYPVIISKQLKNLTKDLTTEIKKRQNRDILFANRESTPR